MEQLSQCTDEHLSRDYPSLTIEQFAIQSLVDKLFRDSDAKLFALFNRQCQETFE